MYKCAKMCLKYIFGTSDSHSGTSVINMIHRYNTVEVTVRLVRRQEKRNVPRIGEISNECTE